MKIGILTLPLHTNYGGVLQAYALQTILQRMGHEVVVIDQDRDIHRSIFRQTITLGKYLLDNYLLRKKRTYFNPKKQNREQHEREQHIRTFINKYINIYKVKKLSVDFPKNIDAVIVGSDQVWRYSYFMGIYCTEIANAFLKFAEKWTIKRIAYAASFGTDSWEYTEKETAECARLLKRFDAVSVREKSAIDLCGKWLGYNGAVLVLDPTMLLSKGDYTKLVKHANTPKSPGNLLCYILDNTKGKQALIEQIAEDRGLQPFSVNSKADDPNAAQAERIQPPVEYWLRGFMDAEFVVTDSFHACVFSIIFGKPFVVVGNKERGMARFNSLLSTFSLEQNLISSIEEYIPGRSYQVLTDIKERHKEILRKSLLFLEESLTY